jgi:hypothetical protein
MKILGFNNLYEQALNIASRNSEVKKFEINNNEC